MTREEKDKLCLDLYAILTELDNCKKYSINDEEYTKQLEKQRNNILKTLNKYYK